MLCRNGLHELGPDDPWRGRDGSRCRACYLKQRKRANRLFYPKWYADNRASVSQRVQKRKARLAAAGLCTDCKQPSLSKLYCWDCLSKKQDRDMLRAC